MYRNYEQYQESSIEDTLVLTGLEFCKRACGNASCHEAQLGKKVFPWRPQTQPVIASAALY